MAGAEGVHEYALVPAAQATNAGLRVMANGLVAGAEGVYNYVLVPAVQATSHGLCVLGNGLAAGAESSGSLPESLPELSALRALSPPADEVEE